jgi:hypothetical protein
LHQDDPTRRDSVQAISPNGSWRPQRICTAFNRVGQYGSKPPPTQRLERMVRRRVWNRDWTSSI